MESSRGEPEFVARHRRRWVSTPPYVRFRHTFLFRAPRGLFALVRIRSSMCVLAGVGEPRLYELDRREEGHS